MDAGHAERKRIFGRLIDGGEEIGLAFGKDREPPVAGRDVARRGVDADELKLIIGKDRLQPGKRNLIGKPAFDRVEAGAFRRGEAFLERHFLEHDRKIGGQPRHRILTSDELQ